MKIIVTVMTEMAAAVVGEVAQTVGKKMVQWQCLYDLEMYNCSVIECICFDLKSWSWQVYTLPWWPGVQLEQGIFFFAHSRHLQHQLQLHRQHCGMNAVLSRDSQLWSEDIHRLNLSVVTKIPFWIMPCWEMRDVTFCYMLCIESSSGYVNRTSSFCTELLWCCLAYNCVRTASLTPKNRIVILFTEASK